jgi:hypothetical protein
MRHEFGLPALPSPDQQARICNPNVPAIEAQALTRAHGTTLVLSTRPPTSAAAQRTFLHCSQH